jgi:metallo-beta-lactamase family protein
MDYFSAHADYGEIIEYLKHQKANKVKQVFLVHGEMEAQESLKVKLEEVGYTNITIPILGEQFEIIT